MSADLHIHVLSESLTERDLAMFFSNVIGSKYETSTQYSWEEREPIFSKMEQSPNIWIGEVSWLKAGILGDAETYIPDTVSRISELVGEDLPMIDDKFIDEVKAAFSLKNNTIKGGGVWNGKGYSLNKVEYVVKFLETYKGEKVFTVSW